MNDSDHFRTYNLKIIHYHPETPAATPEVVSSMINYLVKPEAYFLTGMKASLEILRQLYLNPLSSTNI